MTTLSVLIAQLMASSAMAAIAAFVQSVHYPLFAHLPSGSAASGSSAPALAEVRRYHEENLRRTRPIVLVPMAIEAASAAWLAAFPPERIPRAATLVGLALVGIVILSTALVQVPLHAALRDGAAPAGTIERLVRTTGLRTAIWLARALLAAWMLHAFAVGG